jgi:hypothetical protein
VGALEPQAEITSVNAKRVAINRLAFLYMFFFSLCIFLEFEHNSLLGIVFQETEQGVGIAMPGENDRGLVFR